MEAELFKVQTPVFTTEQQVTVLIYNQDKSTHAQLHGDMAKEMIDALNMEQDGGKVYVECLFFPSGKLVVNVDSVTTEDQGW